MLNFTVGPVMSSQEVLEVAHQSAPYFRTEEFSSVMKENERIMLSLLNAPKESRCVFLTASGTGAMESSVMNVLSTDDRVLVINGGGFGQRFVDLCKLHKLDTIELTCEFGKQVKREQLLSYASKGITALLVNMHETSSGLLYDMDLISEFCRTNNILLMVDAISAFIADELDMSSLDADVVITGSQKALAVHPGVSIIALSPRAQKRVEKNPEVCLYLSLKQALLNGVRGQTPWTPAVSILMQINTRLKEIERRGMKAERARIEEVARQFRDGIKGKNLVMVPENPSNAVTALWTSRHNAKSIIEIAKNEYNIWLCPNGGALANEVFRVGHIGEITAGDLASLLSMFDDLASRGLL